MCTGGPNKASVVASAYVNRCKPIKLTLARVPPRPREFQFSSVQPIRLGTSDGIGTAEDQCVSATSILENDTKLRDLQKAFSSGSIRASGDNGETRPGDSELAEVVAAKVRMRLKSLIDSRIHTADLRKHESIDFFTETIGTLAALGTNFRHFKSDLVPATADTCLIKHGNPGAVFRQIDDGEEVATYLGAYGYYHNDNACFARVGSAGRGFLARHKEHASCARLLKPSDSESRFYTTYPREEAKQKAVRRRGVFEQLTQYAMVGFSQDNFDAICKVGPQELFPWTKHRQWLEKQNFGAGFDRFEKKQIAMVCYALETFYGLCLAEKDNVSQSFGFEKAGMHQRGHKRQQR